ncbi:NAD(P)H-hydrate dehydratase [Ideonella sp. BN130291]|uniref:NAD(P)H-hydrate dehydratase n=1 Tax=Ideonella sp. BN130291 TaxID=3112940 RepID=UPI002E276A06|nr:NAD(P)H-hydrate dehydratase [Ideonella sp. BN130291]
MPSVLAPPVPVLPGTATSWPLHGLAASRAIEQASLAGLPPHTLMHRAGTAVARLALAVAPHAQHIWIAAGPGNNGGDGLQAAIALQAAGKRVSVSLLAAPERLPPDARDAYERARQAGVPIEHTAVPTSACELGIDALLGLGSNRPVQGEIGAAVDALNRLEAPVLAVDLPSGLQAQTGALLGGPVVHADHTLCLLSLKPGLFTGLGRDHAGRVWLSHLGNQADAPAEAWLSGSDGLAELMPLRRHAQHKGSFGDTVVVGGATGMEGAAWLAARAALCAGAGRVYLDLLGGHAGFAGPPELMCRPGLVMSRPQDLAKSTVVCGCGGGNAVGTVLLAVLEHSARLVLDADALNTIAADASLQQQLARRHAQRLPTLLTPHPLEAARLLGCDAATVQADRFRAAAALADRLACAVLLKGSGSVCAAPGQPPQVNPTGNALLASAGTGDVLAGWAAGLWSQQPRSDVDSSAEAQVVGAGAAWLHGQAADAAQAAGRAMPLTASTLIDAMVAEATILARR